MADKWIKPGELTTRKEMKAVFGGGQGQGIQPCSTSPNVLLYTDPASGEKSGYYDGWLPTDDSSTPLFEYTGDGEGDQVFHGRYGPRNRAILMHAEEGRALRVFKAAGRVPGEGTKLQRYVGKFKLDEEEPYVLRQAPNQAGELRRVIVFRLRPVDELTPLPEDTIAPLTETEIQQVPVDTATSIIVDPETYSGKPISRSATRSTKVERREAELCEAFRDMLEEHEHQVRRFQIRTSGLSSSLLTDLYDTKSHVLYEAKGTSSRESVRMAIGQLMDYRRHINPNPTLAVLLPKKPNPDLQDLLESVNINLVYQDGGAFVGWPIGDI
ncbi:MULTISPECIES: hypothetical protein [Nocardiopsis]|uniref:hypothetical protein n=1 Tax=Nocardiopsis TaxID=2013 RepID=UPI00117F9737|nr:MULTISPECIES: hypothetical protein [Nocardiopsis]